jgi:hypothetical protein
LVVKFSQGLQFELSLLKRFDETTPLLSVAVRCRLTMMFVEIASPLLMTMVPLGAVMSERISRLVEEEARWRW